MASERVRPPRTYLVWSALATFLCMLPLGVIALAYGLAVRQALGRGDGVAAARRSRVARRWLVATIAVGLLVEAVIMGGLVVLGGFSH